MKKIRLACGLRTLVDDDVWEWAHVFRWHAINSKGKIYVGRKTNQTKVLLHTSILPVPLGMVVDHRDGDTLDNRRENLRAATRSQNAANRPPLGDVYKGVRFSQSSGGWIATVVKDGTKLRSGICASPEAAAAAYDKLASAAHGEFAWLNAEHFSLNASATRGRGDWPDKIPKALQPFTRRKRFRLYKRDPSTGRQVRTTSATMQLPYYCRFTIRGRSVAKCLYSADTGVAQSRARFLYALFNSSQNQVESPLMIP